MQMQGKDLWPMAKQTVSEFFEDKAQTLAAALAIFTMLSIAPLLVIVTKIVGVMYKDAPYKVSQMMTGVLPGMESGQIEQMVKKAGEPGNGTLGTIISTIVIIFGATGVFGQLQDSMNTIWEVKPKPLGVWGWIRARFLSFAMVLGIAFLLMVSTVGTAAVTTVGTWVAGGAGVVASLLSHVVSLAVMTLLFLMIFKVLPDAQTTWRDCLVGAVITAVLFEMGKVALEMYLKGSATQVFGAAGSLAALLLFVFYSAQIMFLGAEFTKVYAERFGAGVKPDEKAVMITEEDRAQQGRPTEGRMAAKVAQDAGHGGGSRAGARRAAPPRTYTAPQIPAYSYAPADADGGDRRGYVLAGAGLVVGAVAGALGARSLLNDPSRPTRKHIQAVKLNERLNRVEQKVGRVSRLKEYLDDAGTYERIRHVERQIRHARTVLRSQQSGRPAWLVKLGDMVAGNK